MVKKEGEGVGFDLRYIKFRREEALGWKKIGFGFRMRKRNCSEKEGRGDGSDCFWKKYGKFGEK